MTQNTHSSDAQTQTEEYADDEDFVSIDETTLQRDPDTGQLEPEEVYVEELGGPTLARPMKRDEREQYIDDVADEESEKEEVTDKELAELFDRKLVKPDLSEHEMCDGRVTEKFVREGLTKNQEDGFYIAVLLASGETDVVRMIRGDYTEREMEMMRAQAAQGNLEPQGERSENETRRDRRTQ